MARVRIGISGWTYAPWRGKFYPEALAHSRELEFASRQVRSIEINGTFYSLQRASSFEKWYSATPDDFVFSVKGSRYITHIRRLREIEAPLANFFASGVLALGEKLGPFLWQFPPNFRYEPEKMEHFFKLLPKTAPAAAGLAKHHDEIMEKRAWKGKATPGQRLRHAVEVRHSSFENPDFIALLRRYRIALVVADTAGKWPFMEDVTGDFVYVRLHGDKKLYESGYTESALERWAGKIEAWARGTSPVGSSLVAKRIPAQKTGRDVYVYFDNDVKVHAPRDARKLAHRLGKLSG